ncbi:phospholipase-like, Aminotransferase-like mobile domain protein [Artemisia annua]|uniref:Phospholipase-like, Aminotransferase-like mobile domain protein n=1 Tax=Artemisia annua TaxID=35608 RepID=A0A2U1KY42_ARTAN|nr:phospholipase-like, Aminotransferase-like mobile domain protein [Artemisia annua]
MANLNPLYDVKISIRSSVKLLKEMKGKLESKPNRESLFRSTVFGPWLDVPYTSNDSLLMHYVLQHQVSVSNLSPDFPIIYHIGDHYLQFGRKEFCLITGFRFGNVVTPKARKDSPFSDRVFPEKKSMAVKSVKGIDLLKLLRGDRWLTLSDDDAVRVCLLIACELVFMGREDRNVIPNHIMALVEHFHEWNVFPWGEYMWEKFYSRTVNVVPKHSQLHLNAIETNQYYQPTYNLYGFCWAFKIWILETFPKSSNWWVKNLNVIPRGIAWTKVATFGKLDYSTMFGQEMKPTVDLFPTLKEMREPWFIASVDSGVVEKGHVDERKDEDSVHGHGDGEEAVHTSNVLQSDGVVDGVNEPSNSNLASNFSMAELFQQINDCKRRLALMENRGSRMMEVVAEVEEIKSKIEKLEGFFNVDAKTEDVVNNSNVEPKHSEQTDDGSYVNTLTSNLPPHQSPRCSKASDQNDPTTTVSADHPDDFELLCEPVKRMEIDQEDVKTTVSPAGKDNGPDLIEPVKPMEIDEEDGKVDYNDSQLYNSSMQFLLRSPAAPAFDAYPPVVVAAQSLLNLNKEQTVSNAEEGHFTDEYFNFDNADKNADEFSLDDFVEGEYIHDKDGKTEGFAAEMVVPGCNPVNKQDIPVSNQDSENQTVNHEYVNVVKPNQKPCLSKVFAPVIGKQTKKKTTSPNNIKFQQAVAYNCLKRKKKKKRCFSAVKSEPVEQPSNAPRVPKTRSMMVKAVVLSPMVAEEKVVISPRPVPNFHKPVTRSSKTSITSLKPFQEDLSRPNARTTVNVPEHIRMFLKEIKPSKYWFPWGRCDIHVDRRFCSSKTSITSLEPFQEDLSRLNARTTVNVPEHIRMFFRGVVVTFIPNEADWAVASPHFSQAILGGVFPTYYSDGVRYPIPWKDVERVRIFPINEPDKHWILAELHIATGVVTFYDSLGLVKSNRRSWWRGMKKDLPSCLISYLNECGVLKSKGISVDMYDIQYDYARVPVQGGLFGDCGVWVCICLYRLCRNEQLEVKDPVQAALAYRERMLDYYFDNKVEKK